MRLSLGSVTVLTAAFLVAFAFWPQQGPVRGPQSLYAQNKAKDAPKAPALKAPTKTNVPVVPRVTAENPLSSDVGNNPRIEGALDAAADFTIDPQPLKDAIDFIAQRYHIPIILDNKALEDASIDTTTEVKMPVAGAQGSADAQAHARTDGSTVGLRYPGWCLGDYDDGKASEPTRRRCLRLPRSHQPPTGDTLDGVRQRSLNSQAASPGMFAVSPTTKGKQPAGGNAAKAAPNNPEKNAERAESTGAPCTEPVIPLISVIQYAGDEDDWHDEEGGGGKVTELGGLLVVNQNPIVHEQIKRILADLRRMRKEGAVLHARQGPRKRAGRRLPKRDNGDLLQPAPSR